MWGNTNLFYQSYEALSPTKRLICTRCETRGSAELRLVLPVLKATLEIDGHAVITADDPRAGIELFQAAQETNPFNAVMTDLGMPHLDGRAVARAIKQTSPNTLVILLTGWGRRLDAEGHTPQDIDHVLAKPPKLRELRAALAPSKPL